MSRRRNKVRGPWNSYESGLFEQPNSTQVRHVIEEAGFTQAKVAALLGVAERTIRRYCDPSDTADMPYAQWELLRYHANYDIGDRAILADTDGKSD